MQMKMRGIHISAVLLGTFLLGACAGEGEPECPTDDCTIPGASVVKWRFHEYPQWNFLADTCIDLEVATVRVEAINVADPALYFSLDKQCGEGQATFLRMPEGTYDVLVTPLDAAGNPLVIAGTAGQIQAGFPDAPTETVVNVPYTAWTNTTYTGTFLFELSWGGLTCETAGVAMQNLRLMIKGNPSTKMADNGQKLDGTEDAPCRSHTLEFAQFAEGLPFGPVMFKITGKDAGGLMKYEREFETFIGVGKNNPTLTFDVPAPPPTM